MFSISVCLIILRVWGVELELEVWVLGVRSLGVRGWYLATQLLPLVLCLRFHVLFVRSRGLIRGLWFVVCGLWFVVRGAWCVVWG